jgi:hypothetical protein
LKVVQLFAGGEAMRVKMSSWIRDSGVLDGVADSDSATRDLMNTGQLLAIADSGGHLHPNDAGYTLMGDVIDLKFFAQ